MGNCKKNEDDGIRIWSHVCNSVVGVVILYWINNGPIALRDFLIDKSSSCICLCKDNNYSDFQWRNWSSCESMKSIQHRVQVIAVRWAWTTDSWPRLDLFHNQYQKIFYNKRNFIVRERKSELHTLQVSV